ncbi:MAG: polysaccharide biosynthesis/export family protein [Candidatus Omnitrophota bacterium]|nr:MAG: polysaccharide biosynthesis/export family protein [Candidatus Omnitrophota bacterium]
MVKKYVQFCSLWIVLLSALLACSSVGAQDIEKAKQHYKLGEMYYEHELYQEAEQEFQKALELLEDAVIPVTDKLKKEELEKKEEHLEAIRTRDYAIGEGDTLHVAVWENPDLTQEVIVRPDGKISFPLIDEIQARGLTISELDEEITKGLKEYIHFPDVSISLRKMGGSKVVILGQVRTPGVYSLTGRRTVIEGIALAGGFTSHSVASSVIVIKASLTKPTAKRVNLTKALHKADSGENIVLESEDVVFVPKKFIAIVNYFMQQIVGPISKGAYTSSAIKNWE